MNREHGSPARRGAHNDGEHPGDDERHEHAQGQEGQEEGQGQEEAHQERHRGALQLQVMLKTFITVRCF